MPGAPEILLSMRNLVNNLRHLQKLSGQRQVFPVIKADAYGHGAVLIARALEESLPENEVPLFCVARVHEALELRAAGIGRRLLVLSHFTPDEIQKAPAGSRLEIAVHDAADLERLASLSPAGLGQVTGLHLNLNTGMNRLGFRARDPKVDLAPLREAIQKIGALGLPLAALMSHFACSEQETPYNDEQEKNFLTFVEALKKSWPAGAPPFSGDLHMANSAASARGLACAKPFTAIRPGLYLWGARHGDDAAREAPGLQPVMRVRAPLRQVFQVRAGETLGYGQRYRCPRDMWVGCVAFGYADGLRRSLSRSAGEAARAHFLIEDHRAPLLGTVSMDLTLIDLTDHPGLDSLLKAARSGEGAWAYWIYEGQGAEALARELNTIPYEVFCALGHRVRRLNEESL